MIQSKSNSRLLVPLLVLAAILRIMLAYYNDGSANDIHLEVAEIMQRTGTIPKPGDCWQCYHPKLYPYVNLKLWQFFCITDTTDKNILGQMLNAIAGIITLVFCLRSIRSMNISNFAKVISFALIAFNPRFIAINTQASNDSFIILFGTIIIYAVIKLAKQPALKWFSILLIASFLAGITKASFFVLFTAVILFLIIKIFLQFREASSSAKQYLMFLSIYTLSLLISVGYVGEYYYNYKTYGKLTVYNTELGEIPHLYKQSNFRRPGVQSLIDGYATFRIVDMIKTPMITNEYEDFPLHRTSVWSQIYGRAHFLYFDNWPPNIWQTKDKVMLNIGRLSLLLALLPTLFLLLGIGLLLKAWWLALRKRKLSEILHDSFWALGIFWLGFTAFIIVFTLKGRDYSFMKAIYLYPAILISTVAFGIGINLFYEKYKRNKLIIYSFASIIIVLIISYLIPIIDLVINLKNSSH